MRFYPLSHLTLIKQTCKYFPSLSHICFYFLKGEYTVLGEVTVTPFSARVSQ